VSLPAWAGTHAQWLLHAGLNVRFEGIRWIDFGSMGPPILILALLIALFAPNTQEIMVDANPCLEPVKPEKSLLHLRWAPSYRWAFPISAALLASVLSLNRVTEFLYFQF
jgi:hypothetical protein